MAAARVAGARGVGAEQAGELHRVLGEELLLVDVVGGRRVDDDTAEVEVPSVPGVELLDEAVLLIGERAGAIGGVDVAPRVDDGAVEASLGWISVGSMPSIALPYTVAPESW
jgi:hypothetical protein